MSYPGDTSLSNEIKERILTTFEQALGLAEEGSRKEALLGCDFVLRLDPLFEPARILHRRLRDTDTEIVTDDLRHVLSGDPGAALDLNSLEAATDGLEVLDTLEPPAAEPTAYEPTAVEPPTETASEGSFADRVAAELDASFGDDGVFSEIADTEPTAEESAQDELLSPDTELSEPSLSEPILSGPADTLAEEAPVAEDSPPEEDADAVGEPAGSSVQLDLESQRRIDELLSEGQDSFDVGEYQSAIDSWSRVFLIDIDHSEASRRIEEARRMAAEAERQVEEVFHEAMSRLDEGDLESAREALTRVLDMQPTHLAALEYLERIDAGDVPQTELPEVPDLDVEAPPDIDFDSEMELDSEIESEDDLFVTPDLEPLPEAGSDSATAPVKPPKPPRKRDARRLFISVGSAVFVLVLLGGWFLWDNWSLFFPNSQSAQDVPAVPRIDPIRRAQALHEEGKTAIAIAQLRRLPPGDPNYAEAQALVAQWETAAADAVSTGPTAEDMQRFRGLISTARSAHAAGENLLAADLLQRAATIAALEEDALAMQADAEANLAPLREQIEIFRSGDWEYALPTLWRMRESSPDNADITRLIVDCYYNLGVRDLQRGRPDSAVRKFEEALNLRPEDRTLNRLRAFAETYGTRPEDLLYRIFVKYLPFR